MDYVINPHHNAFFRASLDSGANNGVAGSGMESTWIASVTLHTNSRWA
jgi:hypothetical protein